MKRRLEVSELIFKILAYTLLTAFAICCLYPFVYAISSAISGRDVVDNNEIILLPKDIQFAAFAEIFKNNAFWISYANTLFLTFYGTVFSLFVAILGGYALSKKRLLFRKGFNFILVFTMWFSAGVVPQYLNYKKTLTVFNSIGIQDTKWMIVIAMGMAAMNIILLRNAFEGVPSEIEEAAIVDGATELQVLTKVYVPMSKSTIATVGLFFGISRWNGYYWAQRMIPANHSFEWPLQVYIRRYLEDNIWNSDQGAINVEVYSLNSIVYTMVICAIIPILIIYPYIQKYFAKGVNMGGVKE
ncbi:MAG: carbohydrate ABC transporter permease [Bacilli bacterium]|nr:carbohydrate ABC transporter permease [Bacilli bacterium]MBP5550806.1 carbohydrate ABC transporter permease [Bacilli bacterium]